MESAETARPPIEQSADWLSIGPASRLLGVDPDTLRRWADDGRIQAYATPGGHRRFSRRSLDRVALARRTGPRPLATLGATPDRLTAAYRRRYATPRTAEHTVPVAVPNRHRDAFRDDGRRLVTALLAHLDAEDTSERERAEAIAGSIVDDLGRRLARTGVELPAAIGLFVAARRPFLAELGAIGRRRALEAARLSEIYERASALLDRLLLRFVTSHQRPRRVR
jgi:excisionase family DNA binding protein